MMFSLSGELPFFVSLISFSKAMILVPWPYNTHTRNCEVSASNRRGRSVLWCAYTNDFAVCGFVDRRAARQNLHVLGNSFSGDHVI
jgi:hypothetical protein